MADAPQPPAETTGSPGPETTTGRKLLFWACFIALIATSFGFIVRALVIGEWAAQFGLTETQKGEIFGVGLWPFAISIVLFSLIIDKIGYGKAMVFAFVCHIASAIITIATPYIAGSGEGANTTAAYWTLYIGTFIVALANGTVEAVINPVVATMFPNAKTKWLNILHAGWPGGLVLGGLLALFMGSGTDEAGNVVSGYGGMGALWQWKVGLILLPTLLYGVLMLGRHFPVSERVLAGVSYRAMLRETGVIGALIIAYLIFSELTRVAAGFVEGWEPTFAVMLAINLGLSILAVIPFAVYVGFAPGRWMFIFLLLIMIPLATTELGTDSWIAELMGPAMEKIGLQGGLVLVYTSFIMMVLRFFAGPIVHRLNPLGLLAVCSVIAAVGLILLSQVTAGVMILVAATVYGVGKSFFWPTMLGVVAEQFPKGGALTLNGIAGVGMLGVGVIGAVLLGNIQDKEIDNKLDANYPAIHEKVAAEEKVSVFGKYQPLDEKRVDAVPAEEQEKIKDIRETAKRTALATVAIFPGIMFVCYVILILYFRAKGGYKPVEVTDAAAHEQPEAMEGPVEQ